MDPVTLFLAAIAAGGKMFEGFSAGAASDLQAKISASNAALLKAQAPLFETRAQIQETGADLAFAKGAFEQSRLSDKIAHVIAAQPGHYEAAGLSSTAVSPLVAAAYSAAQGKADLDIIGANAALEAAAARTQAANTRMQGAQVLAQAAGQDWQTLALTQRAFSNRVAGIVGAGTAFLTVGKSGFKGMGAEAPLGAGGMGLDLGTGSGIY